MTAEQVKRDLGDAFLVIQGEQRASASTNLVDDPSGFFSTPEKPPPTLTRGLVYVVTRKPSSTFAWVSVGRHENNDVWIPHASLSRFHALLKNDAGSWSVLDAKSANGTFVANEPVRVHGAGDASPIRSGQEIRFGDVITLFFDASGIASYATRTRSRGPMPGIGS